jgi:large subunit ribosomal protein L25
VKLSVGNAQKSVLMRDVQVDPLTDAPQHIDFQEVAPNDVVNVSVPLNYVGLTREQEKEGSFKVLLRSIEVVSQVSKIPVQIDVSVAHLKVDESAHLSDLVLPEGVKAKAQKSLALASLVKL